MSCGSFDPLLARRIVKRFETEGVRFEASDTSYVDMANARVSQIAIPYPRLFRHNQVELFIHPDDAAKGRKIIEET